MGFLLSTEMIFYDTNTVSIKVRDPGVVDFTDMCESKVRDVSWDLPLRRSACQKCHGLQSAEVSKS